MAADPNLNSGGACRSSMSVEGHDFTDFTDLYQNEESLDLSNYMSTGNLELCSDDLFQNLFPPNSPVASDLKQEKLEQFDEELDSWYTAAVSNPPSNCASACSSAAPSPVPFNYYNTPPVTPQADKQRAASPHHLQVDGLTTTMSSSRFAAIRNEEAGNSNLAAQQAALSQQPIHIFGAAANIRPRLQKQEVDTQSKPRVPALVVKEETPPPPLPVVVTAPSPLPKQAGTDEARSHKRPASEENSGSPSSKKSKQLVKGSMEYVQKRQRNNVAVRRSRDKAKQKALETQRKVEELSSENTRLHERVAELSHELNTLKNLLKSLHQVNA